MSGFVIAATVVAMTQRRMQRNSGFADVIQHTEDYSEVKKNVHNRLLLLRR